MKCFYVPGSRYIIDTATEQETSSIAGETLEQIRQRYPDAELWDSEEAFKQIHTLTYQAEVKPPKRITIERFEEMINVMPPMKWRSGSGAESFMICEAVAMDIHAIFCRIGSQYFELADRCSITHEEIVSLCLKAAAPPMSRDEVVTWFYKRALCRYSPNDSWLVAGKIADWLEGQPVNDALAQLAQSFAQCPLPKRD